MFLAHICSKDTHYFFIYSYSNKKKIKFCKKYMCKIVFYTKKVHLNHSLG